jgi:hypothetical protein
VRFLEPSRAVRVDATLDVAPPREPGYHQ